MTAKKSASAKTAEPELKQPAKPAARTAAQAKTAVSAAKPAAKPLPKAAAKSATKPVAKSAAKASNAKAGPAGKGKLAPGKGRAAMDSEDADIEADLAGEPDPVDRDREVVEDRLLGGVERIDDGSFWRILGILHARDIKPDTAVAVGTQNRVNRIDRRLVPRGLHHRFDQFFARLGA